MKIDAADENAQNLEDVISKKNQKNEDLRGKILELEDQNSELMNTVEEKTREIESLKHKISNSDKLMMEYSKSLQSGQNQPSSLEDSSGLYEMIKYLNKQVENLNNEVKTRNQAKLQKLGNKLDSKDKEIKSLLEERKKMIIELREEYTKKIKELKKLYETRIEELEQKVKEEYNENKKIQAELFDKKKLELELKRAEIMNGELDERIKT